MPSVRGNRPSLPKPRLKRGAEAVEGCGFRVRGGSGGLFEDQWENRCR